MQEEVETQDNRKTRRVKNVSSLELRDVNTASLWQSDALHIYSHLAEISSSGVWSFIPASHVYLTVSLRILLAITACPLRARGRWGQSQPTSDARWGSPWAGR